MTLTKNFTLEELIDSDTARMKDIDNTPDAQSIANLRKLAEQVLQPIRDKYGKPMLITSGYRCPKLNKAVGGSKTSDHMFGRAADIVCTKTPNRELWDVIMYLIDHNQITCGQVIWEKGTSKEPSWIHISLEGKHKNQILHM